jgi:hypothetical protein
LSCFLIKLKMSLPQGGGSLGAFGCGVFKALTNKKTNLIFS